jgi:uncharacterized Ntn-hydrolase superfamily protein
MKKAILLLFLLLSLAAGSQDTFSIVAVDTLTGEIGSAGASCIDDSQIEGGAIIISDVIPGRGAIHTQSYWNSTNQQNAHNRMMEGMSPQEIIQWLATHDAQNNPAVRQYGVVDFDSAGHARSAGYTGTNCLNYKNHIEGPNYCIQGNILLGQMILDSIESRFLSTEGTFAEKMMAALQGANVVGADTRCTENGTSSLSAFIRIARPGDTTGSFYCDLNVPEVPEGMEPIDSLQTLFNAWWEVVVGVEERPSSAAYKIYPNPASDRVTVGQLDRWAVGQVDRWTGGQRVFGNDVFIIQIYNTMGKKTGEFYGDDLSKNPVSIDVSGYQPGVYLISILEGTVPVFSGKLVIIN